MKRRYRLFLFGIILLLSVSVVFGQSLANSLGPILRDIVDIVNLYERFPYGADFILYLIFFISLWKLAMSRTPWGKDMKENAVKSIYVILGIISAISVTLVSMRANFTLVQLGPFLIMLLFIVMTIALYNMFGKSKLTLGIMFILFWSIKNMMLGDILRDLDGYFIINLFDVILPIAGFIFIWLGLSELFGSTSSGGEQKGLFDRVADGIKGVGKVKDAYKDTIPGKDKKYDRKTRRNIRNEIKKLKKYLEITLKELRNLGLLDEEEIKKYHVYFMKHDTSEKFGEESEQLIKNLQSFKQELDALEKGQWWGRRSILHVTSRLGNEIKELEPTLLHLKQFDEYKEISEASELLFKQIDNLVAYIQGIGGKIYDEHKQTRNIDSKIDYLINILAKNVREHTYSKMDLDKIAKQILFIDSLTDKLVVSLKSLYEEIRDAYNQAQKIEKDLNEVDKRADLLQENT